MSALPEVGNVLFDVTLPPAGRARVATFSEATQDPNPIHVDDDFAKVAGFPTVLQQGPMTTAQFARLLDEHVGHGRTKTLDLFFTAPVFPEDALALKAVVAEVGDVIRVTLTATKPDGGLTAKGTAELSKPS